MSARPPTDLAASAPHVVADAVARLARPLLVATDVDGTLAPIVSHPDAAVLERGAHEALAALAVCGSVHVAVVSGRPIDQLRNQFAFPGGVHLVGSHGAEYRSRAVVDEEAAARLQLVAAALAEIVAATPNSWLELKPTGATIHLRGVEPRGAEAAARSAHTVIAATDGFVALDGDCVVEACIPGASKATAVERLRRELGAAAVVFVGDDVADEAVFAELDRSDAGVKVGSSPTAATHRLASPGDVVRMLERLAATIDRGPMSRVATWG